MRFLARILEPDMMVTFNASNEQGAAFHFELARLEALVADMEAIRQGVPVECLVEGEPPLLNRWLVGHRLIPCLVGASTGHPLLPGDDRVIGTTDLWLMSKDKDWARTLSRWYRLGRPAGTEELNS